METRPTLAVRSDVLTVGSDRLWCLENGFRRCIPGIYRGASDLQNSVCLSRDERTPKFSGVGVLPENVL